ncbi:MAG TPA: GNAT family N-acetyltransferase [Bacillota bacterium]|nr:GNAT family N-acetyltransferase [Bacillota bacterium]
MDVIAGNYYLLDLQDGEQWVRELDRIRGLNPDLHYRPEYCGLFRDSGEPRLFVYREGNVSVIYPFLLRKIDPVSMPRIKTGQDLYDITSPYGYGGPLADAAADENVWDNFYGCFSGYCEKNDIITEFIRFHPLLGNHRRMTKHVQVERISSVICVDLNQTDEKIWAGYKRNNRKNIKKAYREGLKVVLEETPARFADFISIYRHTMWRNQAAKFYFFTDDFFDGIHQALSGHFLYAYTLLGGKVVSAELLLYNDTYIHSYLGGTLEQFYEYRPNNILKHETIKWAKNRGIRFFLLGGGRSDGDGIYRYKLSFARDGVFDFYVGKKVHNFKAVEMLEKMMAARKPREGGHYFPSYRRY